MKLNVKMPKPSSWKRAALKEFAPDFLAGNIAKRVEGKKTQDVYKWLLESNIWESLRPKQQQFLLNLKPWSLDWLTLEWLTDKIGEGNPSVGVLILTSAELQAKLQSDINAIKERLK